MRKLIYSMTVSLDGYIAGPDGAIDWSVPDKGLFRFHHQQVQETGVHLCGRRLYETMVYWETAEEGPLAALSRGPRLATPPRGDFGALVDTSGSDAVQAASARG